MSKLISIDIVTNAGGGFSTTVVASGCFRQYRYVPAGGGNNLETGASISLVGSKTGFVYLNHAAIGTNAFQKVPRYPTSDQVGAASLYQDDGEPVEAPAVAFGEILTLTIATGGNAKAGTLHLWFD